MAVACEREPGWAGSTREEGTRVEWAGRNGPRPKGKGSGWPWSKGEGPRWAWGAFGPGGEDGWDKMEMKVSQKKKGNERERNNKGIWSEIF